MKGARAVRFKRILTNLGVMVLGLMVIAPAAQASLSQGYATTKPITAGSLVALDQKSAGSVVVADLSNTGRLFGVAVSPSSASVSLGGGSDGQVQVVTTGSASVLVSTANGSIHVGDAIAISPVAGVGQRAVGKVRVIGTAQADFDGSGGSTTKTTIEDTNGAKHEVTIGQIPVVVAVATFNSSTGVNDYSVPTWLQNLSNSVAGKNVAPIRVIIAGLILVVSLISVTVLLYSGVRNSIISIGRNPLSKGSVLKGLLEIVLVAAVILALAAGAMYLVIAR